jgi:hypothetical protein
MPRPRAVVLLTACALLSLGPTRAPASTILPFDLRAIAGESALVVIGQVRAVVDRSTKDVLLEYASIDIATVLQGKTEATRLTVRIRQGLVFFDRRLKRGDSGVFFLVPGENGTWDAAYPGSFALFEGGATLDLPSKTAAGAPPGR